MFAIGKAGRAVVLCGASALAYALAFAPFGGPAAMWIALVVWREAWRGCGPARTACICALWAVTATAGVGWFLPGMLVTYFGFAPGIGAAALVAAGVVLTAPSLAGVGFALGWAERRGSASPWLVAFAWGAAEWLRTHGPIGNPFGLAAVSQIDMPWAQLGAVVGPFGTGAFIAGTAAALADAFHRRRAPRQAFVSLGGACAAVLAALAYATWHADPEPVGVPLEVALVQGAVTRSPGFDARRRDADVERYLELTRPLALDPPDLVAWPEFAVDFPLDEPGLHRDLVLAEVRALEAPLLVGAPRDALTPRGVELRNAVFAIDRSGRIAGVADKSRLVPFAEYRPFGLTGGPGSDYTADPAPAPIAINRLRIGAVLCGEGMYPNAVRRLVAQGANLLANPSNDYWFGHEAAARQPLAAARLRAIESRRWLIRPTATGTTAVIDPRGRVTASLPFATASVLRARVHTTDFRSTYTRFGDTILLAVGIGALLSSLRTGRRALFGEAS